MDSKKRMAAKAGVVTGLFAVGLCASGIFGLMETQGVPVPVQLLGGVMGVIAVALSLRQLRM